MVALDFFFHHDIMWNHIICYPFILIDSHKHMFYIHRVVATDNKLKCKKLLWLLFFNSKFLLHVYLMGSFNTTFSKCWFKHLYDYQTFLESFEIKKIHRLWCNHFKSRLPFKSNKVNRHGLFNNGCLVIVPW